MTEGVLPETENIGIHIEGRVSLIQSPTNRENKCEQNGIFTSELKFVDAFFGICFLFLFVFFA